MLELLLPPLTACLVIVALHAYLGLHVLARGVIFVDLALAQMAALGGTVAILTGVDHESPVTLVWSLGFTTFGALLFSLTRTSKHGRVPQEAIIGIVYVVAAALAILVADRVPHGGEAIKEILVGNLLWVTWPTILTLAGIYAVIGAIQFFLRHRFLTISLSPEEAENKGWNIKAWDFAFYLLFGVVITFSYPLCERAVSVSSRPTRIPSNTRGNSSSIFSVPKPFMVMLVPPQEGHSVGMFSLCPQ